MGLERRSPSDRSLRVRERSNERTDSVEELVIARAGPRSNC